MIMLDGSMVTVALPSVQRELGFSASGAQVVITAYNTALGGGLILGDRIGDLCGRRRVLGLVLSGPLVEAFGWRGVFVVTVPVGATMAVLTPRLLVPASPMDRRLDVPGTVLITLGVAALVAAPAQGGATGWVSPRCLPSVGAVLLFGLVLLPFGMGTLMTMVASTLAATFGVAAHEQGLAGGIRQTSFQLGIAIGVAALVSLAVARAATVKASGPAITHAAALADGYRTALYTLAGLVVAVGALAFTMPGLCRDRRRRRI